MRQTTARAPRRLASGAMRRMPPSAFHGEHAFLRAVLETVSAAGDCHAPARQLLYPRDAGHRDLTRIGGDMYRAMGRYAVETPGA